MVVISNVHKWWILAQLIMDTIIIFFQKVKEKQLALAQSYLIPLYQFLSHYLLRCGHQLPKSDCRMASQTYVIDQWIRVIHSRSQLTTHGTRQRKAPHVVAPLSTIESLFPLIPTFDTSLPMLHVPLLPPLLSTLKPIVPISTPIVPASYIPIPSQPQVTDATLSTLLIMALLDTLQELFMYMDSCIDARLGKMETRMDDLTFFVQQFTSLVIPPRWRRNFCTQA